MTQELVNRQTGELTEVAYTREKVELIKRTIAKGASDDELQLFIHICKRSGLDPFARQIYAIKRWDSSTQKEIMQPQTSIDGYRLIAERTGNYVPGRAPTYQFDDKGNLVSATAYIKKLAGGTWHDISAEAFYEEYVQKKKDGSVTAMWAKMPRVMLAKCAEALAIRRAFPDQTSGLYTVEEMGQAQPEDAAPPIQMPRPKTPPPTEATATAAKLTEEQITAYRKKFHAVADRAGLNDDDKKKFLKAVTGQESTKDLTQAQFEDLIAKLNDAMEPADAPNA